MQVSDNALRNAMRCLEDEGFAGFPEDTLKRALEAALQVVPAGRWMTIDSAPKDGTRFWAYECNNDDVRQFECWWQDDFTNWEGWRDDWDTDPHPTHWQPLPKPPRIDTALGDANE